MRVYCRRTYFRKNIDYFPINGKNFGEDWAVWEKGKYYQIRIPKDYEWEVGIYWYIETEREVPNKNERMFLPLKEKEFRKYFLDVDQLRNQKLNELGI